MFRLLENIAPTGRPREDIKRLVKQCKLKLRVVSKVDPRHQVHLKPKREFLYSGSTITTAINNLANISIALAISQLDYTGTLDEKGSCTQIVQAAESAGYILTGCTPLEHIEDIQFLKNSPVRDEKGDWHPMVNFGVFLRASGSCKGDLPLSGDLRARGEAFQRGILRSTFPFTTSELLDKLRATAGTGPIVTSQDYEDSIAYKVVQNSGYPTFKACTESFCLRYRLNYSEYSDLLDAFATCTFGQVYHGQCVSKILTLDYGLKTVEFDNIPYLLTEYNSAKTEAMF